jgi:hypothetical protein
MRARRAKGKTANKILAIACSLGLIATMIPGYHLQSFGADLATDTLESEVVTAQDVAQDETQGQESAEEVDANVAAAPEAGTETPQDEGALSAASAGKSADAKKDVAAQNTAPKSRGLQLFDESNPEYELVFADSPNKPYTWTKEATALSENNLNGPSETLILRKIDNPSTAVTLSASEIGTYLTWAYETPVGSPVTIVDSSTYNVADDYAYYSAEIEAIPTFINYESFPDGTIYNGESIKPIQVKIINNTLVTPNSSLSFALKSSAMNEDDTIYYNSAETTSIPLTLTQENNSGPYIPITGITWQAYGADGTIGTSNSDSTNLLEISASYNEVVEQSWSDTTFEGELFRNALGLDASYLAADVTLASDNQVQSSHLSVVEDSTDPVVTVNLSATRRSNPDYLDIGGTITVEELHYSEPRLDSTIFLGLDEDEDGTSDATLELTCSGGNAGTYTYTITGLSDGTHAGAALEAALKVAIVNDPRFWDKAGNAPEVTILNTPPTSFEVDATSPTVTVSLSATGIPGNDLYYQGTGGTVIVTESNYFEPQPDNTIVLALDEDGDGTSDATLGLTYSGESSGTYTYTITGLSDGTHTQAGLAAALRKAIAENPVFEDAAGNTPNGNADATADTTVVFDFSPALNSDTPFLINTTAPVVEINLSATEKDNPGYLDIGGTITVTDDNYAPQMGGVSLSFVNNGADLALELSYDSNEQQYTFAKLPDGDYITTNLETALREAIAASSAFGDEAGNLPVAQGISVTSPIALPPTFSVDAASPKVEIILSAAAGMGTNYQGIGGIVTVKDANYEPQTDDISLSFINNGTMVALRLSYLESPSPGIYTYTIIEFPDDDYITAIFETALRSALAASNAFGDKAGNLPDANTDIALDLSAWGSSFAVDTIAPVVEVSLLVTGAPGNSPNYQGVGGTVAVTEHNFLAPLPGGTIILGLDEDEDGTNDATLDLVYEESVLQTRVYTIARISDGTHTQDGLTAALRKALVSNGAFQDKTNNEPDVSLDFDFNPSLAFNVPFLVDTLTPQVTVNLSATAGDDTNYQGISGEVIVADANYGLKETITLVFSDDNKKEITLTLHQAASQPTPANQHRYEFSGTDFLDGAFSRSSLTSVLRGAIAGGDAFEDKASNAPNADGDPTTADIAVNFGPSFLPGEEIIVDTIAPKVTATFDQPEESDKAYTGDSPRVYYQGISGKVVVEDTNYELKEAITLSFTDSGGNPVTLTLHKTEPQPDTLWVDQYQYEFDAADFPDGMFSREMLVGALQTAIAASDDFKDKASRAPVDITVDFANVLAPSFAVDTTLPVVEVAFGTPTKSIETYAGDPLAYYQNIGGTVTVKESNYHVQSNSIRLSLKDSLNNEVILELSYNPDERQYTFAEFPDGNYNKTELEDALREAIAGNDAFKDKAGNAPANNKNSGSDTISLNLDSKTDIAADFVIDSIPLTVDIVFASSAADPGNSAVTIYQNPDDAAAYFQDLAATVTLYDENKLENLNDSIACGTFTLIKSSGSSNQGKSREYTIAFSYGSYSYTEIAKAIQTALCDKAGHHPVYAGAENSEDDFTVNSGVSGFNPADPIMFDKNKNFTLVVDNRVPLPSIISSPSITNTSNNDDNDAIDRTEFDPKDDETGYHIYGSTGATAAGVSVTLSGSDELAGIQQLDYLKVAVSSITAEDLNTGFDTLYQEHEGTTLTVDDFSNKAGGALTSARNGVFTLSYSETYREGDRFIYVLKVTDKAGMVAYYISDGIIVDVFEPAIEETSFATNNLVMTTNGENGDERLRLYNGDVTMNIKVSDNNPALVANDSASATAHNVLFAIPVSSGLAPSFDWVITKDGQTVATPAAGDVPQLSAAEEGGIVKSYGGSPTWNDIVAYSRTAQGSFTVFAPQNNYNNLRATVTVKDATGNYASETMSPFSIDTTGPTVAVSYDNDSVQNDRYFNARRVATITVSDHNFLSSGMNIMAPGASLGAWSLSDSDGDMSTYTAMLSFSGDGDYTLDIAGTDVATNSIQPATYRGAATRDFTIDLTNPVLSVAYDNNDVRNGRYYNAARTGTVTVVEHNFGLGEGATVNATRDGADFSSGGGWAASGDTHTSSIPYGVDGEYTLHVEYTDLAGNLANVVPDDEFIVDLTAPTLEFLGEVQNMRAFNSAEITPLIAFRDQNYDANGARVALSRVQQTAGGDTVDPRSTYTLIANGQQLAINAHNAEVGRTGDGIYTLTAAITDLAGNESESSINYSINRFGSTWYIESSSATQRMLDAYYTNAPATVEIHEVNVSEVQNQQVSFANAGEIVNLSREQGYTVSFSGASNQWKDYTYKLAASNFVAEGLYEVTIYSEDVAGNTSTNRAPKSDELNPADSLPIDFVVDMTAPSIVLTGAENDGRYAESERIIKINVEDNLALDAVDVYLNDSVEPSVSFTATDMKDLDNTAEFRVPTSGDFQLLRVSARDMAGNISDDAVVRNILVNPSPLVQFVKNTPAFAGSIVGAVVLAAAVTFFIVFWHRHRKEKKG